MVCKDSGMDLVGNKAHHIWKTDFRSEPIRKPRKNQRIASLINVQPVGNNVFWRLIFKKRVKKLVGE